MNVPRIFIWCVFAGCIFFVVQVDGQCPQQLSNSCKCSVMPKGLDIRCTLADFRDISKALSNVKSFVDNLQITDVIIPHLDAHSLGSFAVRRLVLEGGNITKFIPQAFNDQKASLEELVVSRAGLTEIPDVTGMKKLKFLDLSGNMISTIADDQFDDNEQLQNLILRQNNICSLGRNVLNETKQSLQLLDLSGNCLSKVPAQNLRGFQNLAVLDLSRNQIGDLPNLQFTNLPELRELHLEGNKIAQIWPLAFMNVQKLQSLYLQENQLSVLEANRFQSFESLELLNISKNHIERIPSSAFQNLPVLRQLLIDGNDITSIETLAFSNNPKLQLISAQDNDIAQLSRNSFDQLPQMQILLLADNQLTSLDSGMLSGMPALQQINLHRNQITEIAPSTFDVVPRLTTLDLSDNKLSDLPMETFTPLNQLFWLDLSNNNISTLPKGVFAGHIANIGFQGPPDQAGKKLKDRMIQKANETFFKGLKDFGTLANGGIPGGFGLGGLGSSLGGLAGGNAISGLAGGIPGFDISSILGPATGNLLKSVPPVLDPLAKIAAVSGSSQPADTGAVSADVNKLIQTFPTLVEAARNANASSSTIALLSGLDARSLNPAMLQYVMNGGQIPGIPQATLQAIAQQYIPKTPPAPAPVTTSNGTVIAQPGYVPGITSTNGTILPVLPLLASLPKDLVQSVMTGGARLGNLNNDQMDQVKQYYLKEYVATVSQTPNDLPPASLPVFNVGGLDLSKIPGDILRDLASGRTPDITRVPVEVLKSMQNSPYLLAQFQKTLKGAKVDSDGIPVADPTSIPEKPDATTLAGYTYNINSLQPDATVSSVPGAHTITTVVLALVGVLSAVTVCLLCFQRYRRRQLANALEQRQFVGGASPGAAQNDVLIGSPGQQGGVVGTGMRGSSVHPSANRFDPNASAWTINNSSNSADSTPRRNDSSFSTSRNSSQVRTVM